MRKTDRHGARGANIPFGERKEIIVVGYPKSGNTFLSRLLGDALNSPVCGIKNAHPIAQEGLFRDGDYVVRQLHLRINDEKLDSFIPTGYELSVPLHTNEKIIYIVRDPRDVTISVKHYWRINSLEGAIYRVGLGEYPLGVHGSWQNHIDEWQNCRQMPVVFTNFESLVNSTQDTLALILNAIDVPLPTEKELRAVVDRQSFDTRRGKMQQHGDRYTYGKGIQLRNLRKGVSGDWKNHYKRKHGRLADRYFSEKMEMFGYEPNSDWVEELPKK